MQRRLSVFVIGLVVTGALASGCSRGSSDDQKDSGRGNPVPQSQPAKAERIAAFNGHQVTGVTVTDDGRLFASFPRWRDGLPFSVAEIRKDGSAVPYPNATWNQWAGAPVADRFTCVQSVVAKGRSLYVLDPSSPLMKGVVGRPMLYQFDLATNELKQKWTFDEAVAPKMSYLNDLRIDEETHHVYVTDSGLGAIVVLDMRTGKARRLLDHSATTKAEPVTLRIAGKPFLRDGKPARTHSDGIELRDGYLYYHALTGYHLYRVATAALTNESFSAAELEREVHDLGRTPAPDGMVFDQKGNLVMADLEHNAIVAREPNGKIRTILRDPNLKWADTFTVDIQNRLIFTDSRLTEAPAGKPAKGLIFAIYRLAP